MPRTSWKDEREIERLYIAARYAADRAAALAVAAVCCMPFVPVTFDADAVCACACSNAGLGLLERFVMADVNLPSVTLTLHLQSITPADRQLVNQYATLVLARASAAAHTSS